MRRTVAIVLIVLGALLLAGSAMALTLNERSETTRPEDDITRVVIRNENGEISIREGDRTEVKRTERWNFVRPRFRERVRDDTLEIRTDCANMLMFNNCGVDLALVVPEDVDVSTNTTNGDVTVTGLSNDALVLATKNGDVDLTDIRTERLSVSTTNGDFTFEELDADELRATTTNGDIDAALTSGPDTASLLSTNGDIDAELPNGSYDLRTATTNGDVSVDDDLRDDPDSSRRVTVTTTNGDIALSTS